MSNRPRFARILPRLIVSLMLVVGAIGEPAPAWAWGDLGHKIVCQIAFQELNAKARAEVVRLIALDSTFDSFTDACTWPPGEHATAVRPFGGSPFGGQPAGAA
jgi:S1/P1 Nuclease